MKHSILALVLAVQGVLLPLPLNATASFFVGTGDPGLFYFDGSPGGLTRYQYSLGVTESIDGLAIKTGTDAYLSANTFGIGSVLRLDGSTFVPRERRPDGLFPRRRG